MNDTKNTNSEAPKKKQKRQGPIRWEAVIPFALIVVAIYVYFAFFFDSHVRHGLEYVGTQANGAEVNIADIDTSFWRASLVIGGIQVTNVEEPAKNSIQIGEMRWRMLWDALLRGKIAIDEASILNIQIGVPRKKPGYVLPPEPPSESKSDQLKQQALDEIQKEFTGNVLGDAAALLEGSDPKEVLKNIEGELKSSLRVKELQDELKKKEQEWKARIDKLPNGPQIKAMGEKVKSVKLDGFKSPQELQASIKELDAIYKEADSTVKNVQETGKVLGTDINTYQTALKDLEDMVQKDIKDLESRFKIPKLDAGSMGQTIFGPLFLGKVRQAQGYMNKAREYMPPKKTAEEKAEFKAPKPRERQSGKNYKFGRPNSYPLFWLRKAEITSKSTNSEFSGDLAGKLEDLTDDPPVLGRPTVLSFKGDFPQQKMFGVAGEVLIDHVTDKPLERLTLRVGNFAVSGQKLVDNKDVTIAFEKAAAQSEFKAELQSQELKISSNSVFQDIGYAVAAKSKVLDDILKGAFSEVPRVTLDASVTGSWTSLKFNIDTNLGRELAKAFERQIQAKVNEARAKLKAFVDEKIGAEKAKLMAEYGKIQSQIKGEISKREEEINKAKAQVDEAKNKAKKDGENKVKDEGKKLLDGLKKKGFKF